MNLKCAIVDDEPLALGLLESYIKKTSFLELSGSYSSAIQAMKYLPDHPVDILFLDIQMPELNGLEFSRMVPEDTRIIFTTAFDQYALDGYRVNALGRRGFSLSSSAQRTDGDSAGLAGGTGDCGAVYPEPFLCGRGTPVQACRRAGGKHGGGPLPHLAEPVESAFPV